MQDLQTRSIQELEKLAAEHRDQSCRQRRRFIEILYYLRRSGRYRESKRYARADFRTYLFDRWMMRETAFERERRAYLLFPEATRRFGPGVVQKAITECGGTQKARAVIQEIEARHEKLKRGITRGQIEKIIQRNRVEQPGKLTTADLRAEVARLGRIIEQRDRTILSQRKLIAQQRARIERLTAALQAARRPAEAFAPLPGKAPAKERPVMAGI